MNNIPDITVPSLSITFMGVSAFICLGGPLILWLILREQIKFKQLLLGLATYLVFGLLFEGMANSAFLADGSPLAENLWLRMLYTGVSTAIFEECSRYLVFRFYMKKEYKSADAALGFGFGFALFELIGVGITAIANFAMAVELNNTGLEAIIADAAVTDVNGLIEAMSSLAKTSSSAYLLGGINSGFGVALQLGMSVIVWYAATREDSGYLLPLGILIHAIVNLPYSLYQSGVIHNIIYSECIYYVMVGLICFLAIRLYKKYEPNDYYELHNDRLKPRTRR